MTWQPAHLFRRRLELRALLLLLLIIVGAFALAQAGLAFGAPGFAPDTAVWLSLLLRYGALLLLANLALSWFRPHADQRLLPVVGLLGGLGLMLLYRLPTPSWDEAAGELIFSTRNLWYVTRQARVLGVGIFLIVLFTCLRFDGVRLLRHYRVTSIFLGLLLLILTAIVGRPVSAGGPRVTLDLGLLSFQPAELIKFLFAVYLAGYLDVVRHDLGRFTYRFFGLPLPVVFRYIVPLLLILAAALLALVMMSDLGVALILLALFPVMVYLALPARVMRALLALTVAGCLALYLVWGYLEAVLPPAAAAPDAALVFDDLNLPDQVQYRVSQSIARVTERVRAWRDPWAACADPEDCASYQALEGLYAVAAGGVWGTGPGLGLPGYIPFAHTDLIFAALAEEWGLLGGLAVLSLYLLLLQRGAAIARAQSEPFRAWLAMGLVTLLALQVLLIVGGTLNLLPLTGITVPFLSFGGTSLLVNSLMVAILLRLSATAPADPGAPVPGRPIRHVARLVSAGFALLGIMLAYWMIWMSPRLQPSSTQADAYSRNLVAWQRQTAWLARVERGRFLAVDGSLLADNSAAGRVYLLPSLAHTLGVADARGLGLSGLEAAANANLLGEGRHDLPTVWAQATRGSWRGSDVWLTIDPLWQNVADQALGAYDGAVVVLDARTGAILALVSHPAYDPSQALDPAARAVLYDRLDAPLLNRALQGLYPPGSTFKTVVAAATLSHGLAAPDTTYDFTHDFWYWDEAGRLCHRQWVGAGVIASCNIQQQQMTLAEGLAWSDNVLFAGLAVDLGADRLWQAAAAFGFGADLPFDLPLARSALADTTAWLQDPAQLAQSGFGQSQVIATPLQMALVAAAVANDGAVPQPHLVARITGPDGRVLDATRPRAWGQALDPAVAAQLRAMLVQAVTDGWAGGAAVDGMVVGGKTGTAEWAGSEQGALPHSWFIGFAGRPDGSVVALAVLVEAAGEGSLVAAPLAGAILAAAP